MKQTRLGNCRSGFALGHLIALVGIIGMGGCLVSMALAEPQRYSEKQAPVPTVEYSGDMEWLLDAEPVGTASTITVVAPERLAIAGDVLANLLSDPSFRYQVQVWFEHYVSINHPREEASRMAKGHAAEIALAFTDALIEAAGG